jgi:SAM-dependent methyltransferase
MLRRRLWGESRTSEQLREHFEIEKELADKLRTASREDRTRLYTSLNDELVQRVSHLPLTTEKASVELTAANVSTKMKFLERFLSPDCTFLEIGPGDCSLSLEVAKRVKQVFAIDVCNEITSGLKPPHNFQLIISDGCSVPVPANSVNVAYSYSLMEHLHPDDALAQLQNVHQALAPGGVYICVTPNRVSGPHDISRYFEPMATGLHLKEYTASELSDLFRKVGFSKTEIYVGGRGMYLRPPLILVRALETLFGAMPFRLRALVTDVPLIVGLLGIRAVARK